MSGSDTSCQSIIIDELKDRVWKLKCIRNDIVAEIHHMNVIIRDLENNSSHTKVIEDE